VSDAPWTVARLEDIERSGTRSEWIPIRRHFGIQAFGVNAWAGDEGDEIIGEHEESSIGHEELYVVVTGSARFAVGGDELDAPAGTIVFVRDPATKRGARATSAGTTILTAGGKPGEAFTVSPWEENADVFPLFAAGEYAEAKRRLQAALERRPDEPGFLYNLACAEARLGEHAAALEHLGRAVGRNESFAEYAQGDEDLESIRSDPAFPAAPAHA
jgi:tetratricopeptide (TPR) repeat protein